MYERNRAAVMDPAVIQALREAKALLDDGVLTEEEFKHQKRIILDGEANPSTSQDMDGRIKQKQDQKILQLETKLRELETQCDDLRARLEATERELAEERSRNQPTQQFHSISPTSSVAEATEDASPLPSPTPSSLSSPSPHMITIHALLKRSMSDEPATPVNFSQVDAHAESTILKDVLERLKCLACKNRGVSAVNDACKTCKWLATQWHNALEEVRALTEKEASNLPKVCVTLQSHVEVDANLAQVHSGAKVTCINSITDSGSSDLSRISGHLLVDSVGALFLALQASFEKRVISRWSDLEDGLACEVLYEGTWWQARVDEKLVSSDGRRLVAVEYCGCHEDECYEEIDEAHWQKRIRLPQPSLHLFSLNTRVAFKETEGIQIKKGCVFKSYGYVESNLHALEAILDSKTLQERMCGSLVQSIANPLARRQVCAFKDLQRYGPRTAAAAAVGATNVQQLAAIRKLEYDVEAIQGPPGTGKSSIIRAVLEDFLPDEWVALVTAVQNKAVCAVVTKLAVTKSVPFIVAGGRCEEAQASLKSRGVLPLTLLYTAWGQALRKPFVRCLAVSKVCSRLMCYYEQMEAQMLRGRWDRAMRDAQQDKQNLEEMGMSGYRNREQEEAREDDWRCKMFSAKWLKLWCRMRFGSTQEKTHHRALWWLVLMDGILHRDTVKIYVPLVEARAKVWLATVDSAAKVEKTLMRSDRRVHMVIVDEAGSVPEWKLPLLTRLDAEVLLMVGDHKQLPPYSDCNKFMPESCMERMAGVLPVTMLKTQYRMHPDICSVVSKHFYHNKLLTAEARAHACRSIAHQLGAESASAIVWYSHTAEEEEDDIRRTSKLNREEARIICEDVLPAFLNKGKSIAVVTFYKGQERLLQEKLGEAVTVMTVDSAQGSEADVVILSCVRSNKGNDIGYVDNRFRLNVALSRAKDQLVIVGNAACFRRERHTSSPVWQDLWQRAYNSAAIIHGAIT